MKKRKSLRKKSKKKTPNGVKIVSGLYYLEAALVLIFGVFLTSLGISSMGFDFGGVAVLIVSSLIIALFLVIIARGLLKAKKWARNTALVLAILGFIGAINGFSTVNVIDGIASFGLLAINGFIALYLILNEESKKFFRIKKGI